MDTGSPIYSSGSPTPCHDPATKESDYCLACRGGKEYSGCLRSPTKDTLPISRQESHGPEDSLKLEMEATCIGNSWSPSARRRLFMGSGTRTDPYIVSSPDQELPPSTSGKRPPLYPVSPEY